MDIFFRDMLSDNEKGELQKLCNACNLNDGTCFSVPYDADIYGLMKDEGKLICAICAYHMGGRKDEMETDEIYAFTLPGFRKKGCFYSVLSFLMPVLRDALVFPVYKLNPGLLEILDRLKAKKDYDEYFMERELTENIETAGSMEMSGTENIKYEETSEDEIFFSSRFCECCIMKYSKDCLYLYGMLTYARFQGMGHGFEFLSELIRLIETGKTGLHGFKRIILQVSSENIPAVKLYKKCGFSVKDSLSFYNVFKKDIRNISSDK